MVNPQLLYPETTEYEPALNVGDLKLVVMGFVDGLPARDTCGNSSPLPDVIFKKVKQAVTVLHENGIVFGDFRPPNVMIFESEVQVLLIDFDWCAKDWVGAR